MAKQTQRPLSFLAVFFCLNEKKMNKRTGPVWDLFDNFSTKSHHWRVQRHT